MAESLTIFDSVAISYDDSFTKTPIGALQRAAVMKQVVSSVSVAKMPSVLELNCGTGEDARWLSGRGFRVFATDASPEMIAVTNEKNRSSIFQTMVCSFQELNVKMAGKKFDWVFSNFGGLNCLSIEEVKELSKTLYRLLPENGKLVLVVMGRNCWWETGYFLLKGSIKNAFRRKSKEAVMASLGTVQVPTYYYSPKEWMKLIGNEFQLESVKPIGFFVPPSYLQNFFTRYPSFLKLLGKMDHIVSWSFLSNWADHYCIVVKRKA